MKTGILALFVLLTAGLAHSGNEGGGGGGICLGEGDKKVCRTLAETGFRLAPEMDQGLEIDEATLDALEGIRTELPEWFNYIAARRRVIGSKGTVVSLEIQDPSKVKVFVDEYKKIILKQDPNFNFTGFELLAFSLEDRTYLIADKFKQMKEPLSRAILLMHETYIRVNRTTVSNAIRMDGMVLDYLKAKRDHALSEFNFWDFYKVLGDSHIFDQELTRSLMVASLVKKGLPLDEIGPLILEGMPYDKSLNFRRFHPQFARVMGDMRIAVSGATRTGLFQQVLNNFRESKRGEKKFFYVSAEELNALTQIQIESEKRPNYDNFQRKFASVCGGLEDRSIKFLLKNFDEYTSMIASVDCTMENNYTSISPNDPFLEGYKGITFGFSDSIRCSFKSNVLTCN